MIEPRTALLLDLFQGPLRDVRFPDADAERLQAALDAANAASQALARAESALEAARDALRDQHRVVAQETERTLAYVRIYAAERPDLRTALDAITAPALPAARRVRGRPRKAAAPRTELFAEAAAEAAAEGDAAE